MGLLRTGTSRRSRFTLLSFLVTSFATGCGFSGGSMTAAGGGGITGAGTGGANLGRGGSATTGAGGTVTSTGAGGMVGTGAAGSGVTGSGGMIPTGGTTGVYSCTPGVEQLIITDCGYPMTTSNPLTATVFSENEVFRAIRPAGAWPNGVVQMFYSDEHAMTLGVRRVVVKDASGTTMMDYPVTALAADPGTATNPQTGTNMLVGDQSGLDASLRPMWPSLFITDISSDPSSRIGDWQQGGAPLAPNDIFGTWKSAVRTVDKTQSPVAVTITPDADPAKNNWNLGGGDPVPAGLTNQGWGAEARWNVSLKPGHSYRLQVLVHDGDQNKGGGDSGEACVLFCAGSDACTPGSDGCQGTGTGGSGGGAVCPSGFMACGPGGIDPASCPSGTVCANGCCLVYVN